MQCIRCQRHAALDQLSSPTRDALDWRRSKASNVIMHPSVGLETSVPSLDEPLDVLVDDVTRVLMIRSYVALSYGAGVHIARAKSLRGRNQSIVFRVASLRWISCRHTHESLDTCGIVEFAGTCAT